MSKRSRASKDATIKAFAERARKIQNYDRVVYWANEVLRTYMPQFNDSRAVDDCLVGLAAAVANAECPTLGEEVGR